MKRHTLARPLAWLFAALVVYASLYPFEGWRDRGLAPFYFVQAPVPRYWSGFDVFSNLVGYMPLGFLLALSVQRRAAPRWAWVGVALVPPSLSFALESLQVYLPARVPSNVDWALNALGGWWGALLAWVLSRTGWLVAWERARSQWFAPGSNGALLLLGLWPVALLYPTSLPFSLGQVWPRLSQAAAQWLADTPWALAWPLPGTDVPALSVPAQATLVALGTLAPHLLALSALPREGVHRLAGSVFVLMGAAAWMGLSSALTHGPAHAWAWLTAPALAGLGLAWVGALLLLRAPQRVCMGVLLVVLLVALVGINRAPQGPYLSQSLEVWAQGRFTRFHGLTQWLGWLWPFAALLWALSRFLPVRRP